MRCRSCDLENRADRRFCSECGAQLAASCATCGATNQPGDNFCGGCGARLVTEASTRVSPGLASEATLPAGERRQLTVLFCDLVGSTALSQQLDAEDWLDVVVRYQNALRTAVERWGGHVAKELGEGLLVYFGWPTAREDGPERAIRAGLAILDAMKPLNAQLHSDNGTRLAVRVGMHTGPVVIADGGEVFGNTANVAARVQAAAEPDTVVITAATHRLVTGMFVTEDRGPQQLKGVREPTVLYRVVQPSGVRSRLDVAAGRLTPLIGRDLELGTLVDRWERAAEGEGQNLLVVGEAGVGKSRLVYELRERLAAGPHTWLECRATPYTGGTPFHPVIDLVQQGLAFAPDDTAADKLRKLERAMALARLELRETVPVIADFLGLGAPERYPRLALNPDVQRRTTMDLLAAWTLALAEAQPLVMLIEDLHWLDPSSLELFGRFMAQTATARVLLIGTARPDFTRPWPARSNLTTIQLARLTKRQAREMISVLGGGTLPPAMIEMLVTRADGVPLYVEELIKGVAEPELARGVEAIPATLADALMARLDRLSSAKEVAQRAAVLGREFSYALLAAVAEIDDGSLRQGLGRLAEAEIVFVRGEPPTATYTFKHALVREAAYGALLKRTRQQLHGRVVDVLVEQFPEQVSSEPEIVARHAEAAGRIDDAIKYHDVAGERAQARSAHEEAVGQFRKAIALLEISGDKGGRHAREAGLQLALGASLIAVRGWAHPETGAAYEQATVRAEAAGDPARLGMARTGLALFYGNRGEVERERQLFDEVLKAAEMRGDEEQAFIGHTNLGITKCYQGEFVPSLMHCERAVALYDPARYHGLVRMLGADLAVAAMCFVAWNRWFIGQPDTAVARIRDAVELGQRLGHPFSVATALHFQTVVQWARRDLAAQRECAAEAIALSELQGFPLFLGLQRALHAAARVAGGEPAALAEIPEALALASETGNQAAAPAIVLVLAEAQAAAGELAAARGTVALGLAVAAQTKQAFVDADLQLLDGDLILATGGAASEAAARYRVALDIAREQGALSYELRAATSLARLWCEQGKREKARDLLAPIYAWFDEGFATRDFIEAKALLDELR